MGAFFPCGQLLSLSFLLLILRQYPGVRMDTWLLLSQSAWEKLGSLGPVSLLPLAGGQCPCHSRQQLAHDMPRGICGRGSFTRAGWTPQLGKLSAARSVPPAVGPSSRCWGSKASLFSLSPGPVY